MPLELDLPPSTPGSRPLPVAGMAPIVIGLLNNMPDPALEATENQFTTLLGAASGPQSVRLRFSYLPEVPRGPAALERLKSSYWNIEALLQAQPDALIVTGTEPRAAALGDEPYWKRLVGVIGWAQENTISSIWSCLAAHAAVQFLDGIPRQRLAEKRFGVLEHEVLAGHRLMQGVTTPLRMPHSRWNDLPMAQLRNAGYRLLSWSDSGGADTFVKERSSLFIFFQGHPEYERTTLFREYRRDVGRYLNGQQASYPPLPPRYLSDAAADALRKFQQRAVDQRNPELFAEFPASAAEGAQGSWQPAAARIYANWISLVAAAKTATAGAARAAQV
jgi:homoserine O-succinyltransferase/O-acetyltransferase